MKHSTSAGVGRLGALGIVVCGVVAMLFVQQPTSAQKGAPDVNPSVALTQLGFKFEGASSCKSEKCHGADKAANKKDYWGNEYTLWHGRKDPHHTAYRTLAKSNNTTKAIIAKLKIADAQKSDRCLNCHSTLAPKNLQGQEYSAAEGVSCNSCHGPSEKWYKPHSTEGWIEQERGKGNPESLLKSVGILDTKDVSLRAERCTSCHLAIEPDLVVAGHPKPTFEMNHFTVIYPDRHWHDPAGAFPAELWANGQVYELRDALAQVSAAAGAKTPTAADIQKANAQAQSHYAVLSALLSAIGASDAALDGDMKKLATAATGKDNAGVGAAAASASAACEKLAKPVSAWKPDKASINKVLSQIGNSDIGKQYGPRGEEQQAYAIEALAQANGDAALAKAVAPILPKKPGEPPAPADFAKGLSALKGSLPK